MAEEKLFNGDTATSSTASGSLPAKWRLLAESWIEATNSMDDFDYCRVRAIARANAYRDCADELEANAGGEFRRDSDVNSTALLASLSEECRKLINASGLEDGQGGGWETYDALMVELRKRLREAESYLVSVEPDLPCADTSHV